MHVRHFGKKAGSFVLYEEDFATYEKKGFGRIRISVDETGMARASGMEKCAGHLLEKLRPFAASP